MNYTLTVLFCVLIGETWSQNNHSQIYLDSEKLDVRAYEDFFDFPIINITVRSLVGNCYGSGHDEITYELNKDSLLKTISYNQVRGGYSNSITESIEYKNELDLEELTKNLNLGIIKYDQFPGLDDFAFSQEDREKYLELVELGFDEHPLLCIDSPIRSKRFYREVLNELNGLDSTKLRQIVKFKKAGSSSIYHVISGYIINQNSDSIYFNSSFDFDTPAYNLPWNLKYKGSELVSYNLQFSKLIDQMIPTNFLHKDNFDNAWMIMEIAYFLYRESRITFPGELSNLVGVWKNELGNEMIQIMPVNEEFSGNEISEISDLKLLWIGSSGEGLGATVVALGSNGDWCFGHFIQENLEYAEDPCNYHYSILDINETGMIIECRLENIFDSIDPCINHGEEFIYHLKRQQP